MSERHPTSDQASGGLPAALSEARAALGTPTEVDRLRSKLAMSLGAAAKEGRGDVSQAQGSELGADASAVASQPLTAATLKVVSLLVGLATLSAVAWLGTRVPSGGSDTIRSVSPGQAAANATQQQPIAPSPVAPSPAAVPEPSLQPPATTAHAQAIGAKPNSVRRGEAKLETPAHASHAPAGAARAAVPETEVQLVTRAQSLLDAQPRAALDVLREHERLYPRGMLREERDVLRIDAEWSLGERAQALAHAREFAQRYPHSAQTRRFNALIGDHKNEPAATRTE